MTRIFAAAAGAAATLAALVIAAWVWWNAPNWIKEGRWEAKAA